MKKKLSKKVSVKISVENKSRILLLKRC